MPNRDDLVADIDSDEALASIVAKCHVGHTTDRTVAIYEVEDGFQPLDAFVKEGFYAELDQNEVISLYKQMANTVADLNMAKIAHNNLRWENILVKATHGDPDIQVKLVDFSQAVNLKKDPTVNFGPIRAFASPEFRAWTQSNDTALKPRATPQDTWQMGVVMARLAAQGQATVDEVMQVTSAYAYNVPKTKSRANYIRVPLKLPLGFAAEAITWMLNPSGRRMPMTNVANTVMQQDAYQWHNREASKGKKRYGNPFVVPEKRKLARL